mgnify:CR=1 FL=1
MLNWLVPNLTKCKHIGIPRVRSKQDCDIVAILRSIDDIQGYRDLDVNLHVLITGWCGCVVCAKSFWCLITSTRTFMYVI